MEPLEVGVEPTMTSQVLCCDIVGKEVALSSVSDAWEESPSDSSSVVIRVLPSLFPFGGYLLVDLPHREGNRAFRVLYHWLDNRLFGQLIGGFVSFYTHVSFHPA